VSAPPDISAAADNLSRSVSRLTRTATDYVHMQLDQADDALAAESRRHLWMFLSAGALLVLGGAGAFFAGLALVIAFWQSHGVLVAALVAAVFLALALVAALVLRNKWRQRPGLLGSIAQLAALAARYLRPSH
jgi:uncharacterized membrane protein YqjE